MLLEEYESADALLNQSGTAVAIVKKRLFAFKEITDDKKKEPDSYKEGVVLSKPFAKAPNSQNAFMLCKNLHSLTTSYTAAKERSFALIEVLGDNHSEIGQWIYTTAMRIIKELTPEDIATYIYEYFAHVPEIKRIQQLNPMIHVGGSSALFFHGIRLKRIANGHTPDIDMCAPFYQAIAGSSTDIVEYLPDEERSEEADFKEVISFNGVKIDYRIDPKEKYEVIHYKGFDFKVTTLETIMEAKFRYALRGSQKHKEDCYEICGKNKAAKAVDVPVYSAPPLDNDDDYPFV